MIRYHDILSWWWGSLFLALVVNVIRPTWSNRGRCWRWEAQHSAWRGHKETPSWSQGSKAESGQIIGYHQCTQTAPACWGPAQGKPFILKLIVDQWFVLLCNPYLINVMMHRRQCWLFWHYPWTMQVLAAPLVFTIPFMVINQQSHDVYSREGVRRGYCLIRWACSFMSMREIGPSPEGTTVTSCVPGALPAAWFDPSCWGDPFSSAGSSSLGFGLGLFTSWV